MNIEDITSLERVVKEDCILKKSGIELGGIIHYLANYHAIHFVHLISKNSWNDVQNLICIIEMFIQREEWDFIVAYIYMYAVTENDNVLPLALKKLVFGDVEKCRIYCNSFLEQVKITMELEGPIDIFSE